MRANFLGAVIVATLASAACHTMTPMSLEQVEGLRPSRVWVTMGDESVVLVSGPQVFGDTLVGYVNGEFEEMPTRDVKQMVVRQRAKGKTVALIAAGAVAGVGLAYMISGAGDFDDPRIRIDCDYEPEHPDCQ